MHPDHPRLHRRDDRSRADQFRGVVRAARRPISGIASAAIRPAGVDDPSRSRQRGQSLIEFAMVVPLLLVIFSGAADLGRAFYNYVALENSVKEGAIYGARFPLCGTTSDLCTDPNTVSWRVQHETRNKTGATTYSSLVTPTVNECRSPAGVTRGVKECVAGDTYVVRGSLAFTPVTPFITNLVGTMTFTSESRAIVIDQAFDPTPGIAPTKFVLGTNARNASELATKCVQPDPTGSPGYYRSPCQDVTSAVPGTMIQAKFRAGDTISYKLVVRNNGGTNVTSVTMDDSLGWPSCPTARPTSMPVGGSAYTCSYTRTAPTVAGAAITSDYTNVFTVTGAEIQPITDTAIVTIEKPPADLEVYKYASVYPLGGDGDGSPNFGFAHSLTVGRTATVSPTVYYKIAVQNVGGQTATGFNLTDSNGTPPYGSATCPAKPTSMAAGATWICIYSKTFTSDQVKVNTASATATGVTPDAGDSDTATVTVASCTGTTKLVPYLIDLTKTTAPVAWTAAGFTGAFTNIASGSVVTQSVQAFSCAAPASTITVTKDPT
jgi:Flp pilus assembly protein TadG